MINVFEGLENSLATINTKPTLKWINITGAVKTGKTEFCVNLAEKLRTVYVDLEYGTKAYKGSFIEASNFVELRQKMMWVEANLDKIKPQVIVLDPIDKLADMITQYYLRENLIDNLGDVPFGKGWSDTRDILSNFINKCFEIAPLVITITHLKLSTSEVATSNITYLDMDLPGKTKSYVQNTVDSHIIFRRAVDDDGKPYLSVSVDPSSTNDLSFGGSRWKEMYDLKDSNDLMDFILNIYSEPSKK